MAKGLPLWSLKVNTTQDALKSIRDAAAGFYTVAAIQVAAGFFLLESMLVDLVSTAVLFVGLAFWLQRKRSRIAAVLLLLLAGVVLGVTGMNQFGGGTGGRNITLGVIALWVALRAVVATFRLPTLQRAETAVVQ